MELFFPGSPEERDALLDGRAHGGELCGLTRIEWDTSGVLADSRWVAAEVDLDDVARYEDPYPVDVGFREFLLPGSVVDRLRFREVPLAEVVAADIDLSTYVEAAAAHGKASASGQSRRANGAHDALADARRRLRARGAEESLLLLLEHPDPSVVMWAAAHALLFASQQGEQALGTLSERDDLVGFSAKQTLEAWRGGTLSFS